MDCGETHATFSHILRSFQKIIQKEMENIIKLLFCINCHFVIFCYKNLVEYIHLSGCKNISTTDKMGKHSK